MSPLLAAEAGEFVITDVDELVYRQITEPLMEAETWTPSSIAFAPNSFDQKKPSFARQTLTTPQDARDWHNENAKKPSLGVWACSIGEVIDAKSQTIDDSGVTRAANAVVAPGHCYVDYRELTKSETRLLRSTLLAKALARKELTTV